tara:strand:- start:468 stop:620 length:153 start_codon:yes stop_codon:yes gene_type:complete
MTQKQKKILGISEIIVKIVNDNTNIYDAKEQVADVLTGIFTEYEKQIRNN